MTFFISLTFVNFTLPLPLCYSLKIRNYRMVMSKAIENHIFRHNWIFRHAYTYKNPHWQSNGTKIFLCKYFRYNDRLFLGCVIFVARCNVIRALWEIKKERFIERKERYMYSFPFPRWRTCWMVPIKIRNIAMGAILYDDIMSERWKIWKLLAI